jgi:hypothetical protein
VLGKSVQRIEHGWSLLASLTMARLLAERKRFGGPTCSGAVPSLISSVSASPSADGSLRNSRVRVRAALRRSPESPGGDRESAGICGDETGRGGVGYRGQTVDPQAALGKIRRIEGWSGCIASLALLARPPHPVRVRICAMTKGDISSNQARAKRAGSETSRITSPLLEP